MFKTILKSLREYKKYAILTPITMIIEVSCECFIPYVMSLLINMMEDYDGVSAFDTKQFVIYCVILVVLAFTGLAGGFLAAKFAAKAATGLAKNLRKDMYYRIQEFSFENIDRFSASSLVTRMTTDMANIQMAFGMIIRNAVRTPLMVVFSVTMCFVMNVKLGIIYLCMVPVIFIALLLVGKFAMPVFNKVFTRYDELNESVEENINGIRVVKNYVRSDYETEKFDKASDNLCKGLTLGERIVALNTPIMQLGIYTSMVVVSVFGSWLIINSNSTELTVGNLSSYLTYGMQILMSLMFLSMILVMISLSMPAIRRVAEVMQENPTISNPKNPVMEVKDGSIEFKNVSFKYNEKAERNALNNVNVKIESGMTVGILGGTGASKTTFVNLISRLYDVTSGEVLVGGENVKKYDLKVLRDQVSVVLQKNILFSGTIASNLRWGKADATQEELERVCKISCADEFINRFPEGYETKIEQGGSNVSGGQKQRLCIARALLKSPKVLILDDSTSAVDTKTDAIIRQGLKEFLPETTKIIIAQRLTSVENADLVIVLDNGEINGVGTNEELLKNNKIYQEVWEIQNKTHASEKEEM